MHLNMSRHSDNAGSVGFDVRCSGSMRGVLQAHVAGSYIIGQGSLIVAWGYAACSSVELASTSARLISITTM